MNTRGKTESPIEEQLFQAMRTYGLEPRCQYKIGFYRVDFAFPRDRLVVEADGKAFHSSKRQQRRDRRREDYIRRKGWDVLRFTGSQIYNAPFACAHEVVRFLRSTYDG